MARPTVWLDGVADQESVAGASLRSWPMNELPTPSRWHGPRGVAFGDATGSEERSTPGQPCQALSGQC